MQYKVCMYNHVMKYLCHYTKNINNNDDINDVSDLPFDEMCLFLE